MIKKKNTGLRTEIQHLLAEDQDPLVVQDIHEKVTGILTPDESITYVCVQKKPVVNPRPDAVVLTNRRFILYRPKILNRVSFEDYTWRSLKDAHLTEGIIGATITLATTDKRKLSIGFLPKNQARRVYALAQEQEERVHEERRRRDLEEKRAASGGVVVTSSGDSATQSPPDVDPVERLQKLKKMVDAGLMSAGEFESKRAEIIESM